MMEVINLDNAPEAIDFCLKCRKARCIGTCNEYRDFHSRLMVEYDRNHVGRPPTLYPYKGQMRTILDVARETGISRRVLDYRVRSGNTLEAAVTMGLRRPRLLKAFGQEKTLTAWCAEYGMDRKTVQYRMKRGIPLEVALTMESQKRRKRWEK